MCRVIIADDEHIECMALEKMIQIDFPDIEIIPSVSNGIDLIAAAEQRKPDIAIVDINMPGMNGLDSLEVIRARNKEMKIIISSAYSEFGYAKRALLLGASDYILKPLNRETFRETLGAVVSELKKEKRKGQDARENDAQAQEITAMLGNEFLSTLMLGEPDEHSFRMLMDRIGQGYRSCVLVTVRNSNPARSREMKDLQTLMEKMLAELNKFCHCAAKLYRDEICLMIFPDKRVLPDEQEQWLSETLEMLQALAGREGWPGMSFGISSWQSEPSKMTAALAESRVAAKSQGRPGICYYTEKNKKEKLDSSLIDVEKSVELLRAGKSETCVQNILKTLRAKEIPPEAFASVRVGVMQAMFLISERMFPEGDSILSYYERVEHLDWKQLMDCQNKEDLEKWLLMIFQRMDDRTLTMTKKSAEYIERTIIFMQEHFMEDISLELAADAAGISSFYLSRLLKQELNKTFVEILTEIRMRHALKMIWAGKYSVKEIAKQSGYENTTYFYKIFKKYTGMSVGELRDFVE